ncbi:type 1 glutamine amidotransferase domain-containing protein [Paraburkholderia sp. ZP32-5]|uniref:type 1 glutamine amidotransferase domain-containing protein n=1 Tax=Paraburkholderia sp. ZP32-5 TaxID=2883245 RepID=UPI001F1CA0EB|nr:type 1 glutamine amidotransferase domain-containing protein [Paraburkholderia sp. ZP32-5]
MHSVLMILTGATSWTQKDGMRRPSGFWAEEFATPHEVLSAAGVTITIATPGGKPATVDQVSLSAQANQGDVAKTEALSAYLDKHEDVLKSPLRIEDLDVSEFDVVFVPGGHGPMQDLAVDEAVGNALSTALADRDMIVAAVCHGQASFLSAGDATSWAFKGRRMTAFTNVEETQVGLAANAPWLLEDRLRDAGASFDAGAPWSSHVVIDGNLVTGQNPQSAAATAKAVLDLLASRQPR